MIPSKSRRKAEGGSGGFTLVEMLVVTIMMGIILAALANITAQWLPNWNRGVARVQRTELVDVALARLVADLGAAEFVSQSSSAKGAVFDGSELSVTFVRSSVGPNTKHGLEVVRIAETADRQGRVLVRSTAAFAPSDPSLPAPPLLNFADPVPLLRAPYRLTFAYAARDGAWRDSWRGEIGLPAIIRMSIRDAASERSLPISTTAIIHVNMAAACVGVKAGSECGTAKPEAPPNADGGNNAAPRNPVGSSNVQGG
jgi:general secretion pathway protein J